MVIIICLTKQIIFFLGFSIHTASVPSTGVQPERFLWFLVCYAATQLATQLRQRCIQVVRSNKEARKRLTKSNGTPAMDLGHMNVVLK